MSKSKSIGEIELELGQQIRSLRLRKNFDQQALAKQAGVALSALKNLESGKGAAIKTLLRVLRALERIDWLQTLAPAVSISPLQMLKGKRVRKRVYRPRKAQSV